MLSGRCRCHNVKPLAAPLPSSHSARVGPLVSMYFSAVIMTNFRPTALNFGRSRVAAARLKSSKHSICSCQRDRRH